MRNTSDSIADTIYGRVEFDKDVEKSVIDSAPFQRLRKIKQLGLCELVFPDAVHTRFTHSIGVMHIAGKYFDAIFKKVVIGRGLLSDDLELLRRIVRLTALLHDVGHGPFSHLFEHMLVYFDATEKRIIKCNAQYLQGGEFGIPAEWIKPDKLKSYFEKPLEHEHYSLAAIKLIFSDIKTKTPLPVDIAQSVCCLMDEDICLSPTLEQILNNIRTKFLLWKNVPDDDKKSISDKKKEIESLRKCLKSIISGEIDADRIDYLARDAQHCGVRLAAGDIDYLLDTLSLEYEPEQHKADLKFAKNQHPPRSFYLLMSKTGIRPFEQLLIARKQMFDVVYSHRINDSFGRLLEMVVEDILQKYHDDPSSPVARITKLRGAPKTAGEFLRMTDDWLERQVEVVACDEDGLFSKEAVTAARMIMIRTPLVRIKNKETEISLEELEDREDQIRQELSDECFLVPRRLKELTKLSRDNARYDSEILRIKPRGDNSRPVNVSTISELLNSTLFTKIKVRLFAFETIAKSAEDQELPDRFRQWKGLSMVPPGAAMQSPPSPASQTES